MNSIASVKEDLERKYMNSIASVTENLEKKSVYPPI